MEVIKSYLNNFSTKLFLFLLLVKNNLNNLKNCFIMKYIKFTEIKTANNTSLYYQYFVMLFLVKLSNLINKVKNRLDSNIELGEIKKYNELGVRNQIIKNTTLSQVVNYDLNDHDRVLPPIIFVSIKFDKKEMAPADFIKYMGYKVYGENTINDIVKLNLDHDIIDNTCEIETQFFCNRKLTKNNIVLVGTDIYGPHDLVEILLASQENSNKEQYVETSPPHDFLTSLDTSLNSDDSNFQVGVSIESSLNSDESNFQIEVVN